ncbi:MAG: AAA family ATPase [Paludibacteraceae bacterium]|nr:AAA family ATPase [Paludibacteraceae bacterium]
MLEKFIQNRIIQCLPFTANEGQMELLDKLSRFITSPAPRKAFILRGYAGTGKTSIMAALVQSLKQLNQRFVLLAPTGRAAKVLSRYAGHPAYTIHKFIYRQKQLGEEVFTLNDNLHKYTLFIIDEASMISGVREAHGFGSGMLLDDLVKYVYSGEGCSLLTLGDDAQLPPVGSIVSPALQTDYMLGYQLDITSHTLTQVARQALDSGILHNATKLRNLALGTTLPKEQNEVEELWRILEEKADIKTIPHQELQELIEESHNEVGDEETILLTRTNKRTNIYNQGIRARILWREDEISSGDRIMISKNNYFWTEKYENLPFLANGDMLEIVRLRNMREMYGYRFVDAQLRALDYDWEIDAVLWIDTLYSDSPEATQTMQRDLFSKIAEDYPELQRNKKELVKTIYQSPYYNALQMRFAYAITGHKSQGGQWKRVFIDPYKGATTDRSIVGDRNQEARSFYRWIYTAITRATEQVYILK